MKTNADGAKLGNTCSTIGAIPSFGAVLHTTQTAHAQIAREITLSGREPVTSPYPTALNIWHMAVAKDVTTTCTQIYPA